MLIVKNRMGRIANVCAELVNAGGAEDYALMTCVLALLGSIATEEQFDDAINALLAAAKKGA